MLLTGSFFRTLDEKLRFSLPKTIRLALGDEGQIPFYAAPGTDGSLALYTEESFSRLASQLDMASPTGTEVRAFTRLFYAQAQRIEVDRNGRLRIPTELAEFAGMQKEIVLLGVRDHIELWDKNRWDDYLAGKQPRYDEIAERAFAKQDDVGARATELKNQPLPQLPR